MDPERAGSTTLACMHLATGGHSISLLFLLCKHTCPPLLLQVRRPGTRNRKFSNGPGRIYHEYGASKRGKETNLGGGMGFCRSSCRCATEFLSSILVLCSLALIGFAGFILHKWREDDVTKLQPPPHYVLLILLLGILLFVSNGLAICGACMNTRCCLGASACLNFVLLIGQLALAIVIFANPSAIDQQVCPPDDAACLEKIDNLFKDPQVHAGVLLALVCGIQVCALCSTQCLKDLQARKDRRDDEEESALDRPLREEDWQERAEEIERKARRKLELHKAALSSTTRAAMDRRETTSSSAISIFGRGTGTTSPERSAV